MGTINKLKKYRQKYKDNDYRLSRSDTRKTRQLLREALKNRGPDQELINFLIDFPAEIGMPLFVSYYKESDREQREHLNRLFVENEKFQKNENFIGVRRATDLINRLIKEGIPRSEILSLLKALNHLILGESTRFIDPEQHRELLSVFDREDQSQRLAALRQRNQQLTQEIEEYRQQRQRLEDVLQGLKADIREIQGLKEKLRQR